MRYRHLSTAVVTTRLREDRVAETYITIERGEEYVTALERAPREGDPLEGSVTRITWTDPEDDDG